MFGAFSFVVLAVAAATPCDGLKSIALQNTAITISEFVPERQLPAGSRGGRGDVGRGAPDGGRGLPPVVDAERGGVGFSGPGGRGAVPDPPLGSRGPALPAPGGRGAAVSSTLPAHCRVVAVLRPSADSEINMELWLPPANRWNGKFQMFGNGGWGGSIQGLESAMPEALRLGYATAATDTGHRGGGEFALGHPEKVIDFAYRAVHEVAVQSKVLVRYFYDQAPRLSYFNSCSGGGRQALMEAQRYPEDFDGIIAGDPANPQIALHASTVARAADTFKDPEGFIPREKIVNVLQPAVMKACDALDGAKDNLISNPTACKFDPAVLLCKAGDRANCLTKKQVETAKRNYAPTKTAKGELVFPGMSFGMEGAQSMMTGGTSPGALPIDTFRYLGHQDRQWDWRNFNIDADLDLARKNAGFIDAGSDLTEFKARGGKLLMFHGWADALIAPESSVMYRADVLATMGPGQDGWLRLFMVPGMGHCMGGQGPTDVDWLEALEKWREKGTAPESIVGSGTLGGKPITRPICPYPEVSTYKGKGNVNNAENFICKAP